MTQEEVILVSMAPAKGQLLTSSQLQKLFFLVDENVGSRLGGPFFQFVPHDYGPFDENFTQNMTPLIAAGLVLAHPWNMKFYQLSEKGQEKADQLMANLPTEVSDHLTRLNKFVRSVTFSELLSSIYKAHPHMAVNAVFRS